MTSNQLPAHVQLLDRRLIEVPRLVGDPGTEVARLRARMLPTVALAGAERSPIVVAWIRHQAHAKVDVLVGGGSYLDGATPDGDRVNVPFPLGAVAVRLRPGQGAASVAGLGSWAQCEARFDVLASEESPSIGCTLDDYFGLLADRPLGWLVVAHPVRRESLQPRLDELSETIAELNAQREGAGAERLRLERAEAELRYLERWSALGFWQLDVWVGSDTKARSEGAAALLSGSADLAEVPIRLRPRSTGIRTDSGTEAPWRAPFLTTADTVAALIRAPARELPGLRTVTAPTFDITPESRGSVHLGQVLDGTLRHCGPMGVAHTTLNRHVFVAGATGSGKSQTVRRILDQLTADEVPWLVIEPAKAEYAHMAGRIAKRSKQVIVIRPGDPRQPPASLNPLEPTSVILADGRRSTFPLQTHVDLVRSLFNASFEATEPFPQILAAALTRCYENLGWNLALGRSLRTATNVVPRYPTLGDLQRTALDVVEGVGYGKEVKDNVRGFVEVRINSLRLGTPGRFFEAGHPLDLETLIEKNVVFEIENIGDDNDKAFFIGTVIIRVFELLRLKFSDVGETLRHVIILEEAHRLLRNSETGSVAARAVEVFANLLAEVRAYGEGIIVAEQIPAKIIPDVVKNSALKIMHRLPAMDDRDFVGSTMNLDEAQSEMVVALPPGRAAVHAAGMDRPVLVDIDGSARALEKDEVDFAPIPVACMSPGCATWCATAPCTLDNVEISADLAKNVELVLWVEVTVAGHLLGEPMPAVDDSWADKIRQLGRVKRLQCTLGQLVHQAVQRRSTGIQQTYEPAKLTAHLSEALFDQLFRHSPPCTDEPDWLVGAFRWRDALRLLKDESAAGDRSQPHPMSPAWKARGLDLKGGSWTEQLEEVRRIQLRNRTPFAPTFLGHPNRLDEASSALSHAEKADARLREALALLGITATWPAHFLCRSAPANPTSATT